MKKWLYLFFSFSLIFLKQKKRKKEKSSWHMAAYVWTMGDKIIRLFYMLFGSDVFDTLPNGTKHIMESHKVPFFPSITMWHPM